MKIIILFISFVTLLLFSHLNIFACSCGFSCGFSEDAIIDAHLADAVFSGTVLESKSNPKNKSFVLVKIKVTKSWKGNLPEEVVVHTEEDSAACGYDEFTIGRSYLVFARGSDAKELYTDRCSGTGWLDSATEKIETLNKNIDYISGIKETVQKETKSILFDEFKTDGLNLYGCPKFKMILWNLRDKFSSDLTSKGYVIIYGNKKNPLEKYLLEKYFNGGLAFWGGGKNISILQGEDQSEGKIQFWRMPAGADKPNYSKGKWNYGLPISKKPIDVSKGLEFGTNNYYTDFYTKILLANPQLNGHFIIYEKTLKKFSKTKAKLIKELAIKNKVSQTQLKFFYKKDDYSNLEFWLYPKAGK